MDKPIYIHEQPLIIINEADKGLDDQSFFDASETLTRRRLPAELILRKFQEVK